MADQRKKELVENSRFTPAQIGKIGRPFSKRELREHMDWLETAVDAVPTPIGAWNDVCGDDGGHQGVAREWLVLIGGPPGAGKTLLALNIAAEAMAEGEAVGYLKLEMSEQQIRSRLYTIVTGEDSSLFEKRKSEQRELGRSAKEAVVDSYEEFPTGADFLYNDFTVRNKEDALKTMAYWAVSYGVEVMIVDFIQRIRTRQDSDLRRRFKEIVGDLADFAEQVEVRVFAVSQLKNSAADEISRGERSPTQHDLYGGMAVAQEANQTWMLDHSNYERPPEPGGDRRYAKTELLCAKNKHGDKPVIPIMWDYKRLRVRQAYPDEL